ncbi:MAG: PEP-CTERM system TPR-repeat protein PrsT, partial [Halioglobus sp.]|nr:PEP-CTERM system TPR-repeat protein PrsT [Halioglobus sp.]
FNGRNPGYLPAMQLLAWLEARVGNFPQAELLLRQVLDREPENLHALRLLSSTLAGDKRQKESVEVLREIVKLSPESAVARSQLGLGMMQVGMVDEGLQQLESARELDSERQDTAGAIVFTLLRENRLDEALAKARELREQNPDSAYAAATLATVYVRRNERDKAAINFRETLKLDADNITARSGLAAIAVQEGKPADAKALYREILEIDGSNLSTALNLAYLNALDGEVEEMSAVLEAAIERYPNAVMPRLALARHHSVQRNHARVLELLEPVQAYSGDNYEYLQMLTEAQYRTGKYQDARRNLRTMTQYAPKNADIRYMYGVTLRRTDDRSGAMEEMDKVLELNPEHVGARFQRAELLLESGGVPEAEKEINRLKTKLGEKDTNLAVLEGRVATAAGNHDAAAAAFQRAFDAVDSNYNLLNLESATWESGKREAAVKLLQDWLAKVEDDSLARFRLGGRYAALGRNKDAASQYETLLESSPNSAALLNNLAWVLREDDEKRALKYAEQALEIDPESHNIKSTLAVLLKNRDNSRAQQLIREALRASAENPSYLYYRALILHEANQDREALVIVNRLLRDQPDFPEAAEARQLKSKLGG